MIPTCPTTEDLMTEEDGEVFQLVFQEIQTPVSAIALSRDLKEEDEMIPLASIPESATMIRLIDDMRDDHLRSMTYTGGTMVVQIQ